MNSTNPDINPVKSFFKSVEKKLLKHSKHLYFKTVISQKSAEAWNAYMANYAQQVRNPLTVTIK